jgi:SAM-dependent methyltransferase
VTSKFEDIVRVGMPFIAGRKTVLDIGCGDGALVQRLRQMGFDAVGIDRNDPQNTHCIQCALEDYEPEKPFDVVAARLSLHHTEDIAQALQRVNGFLNDDGIFLLQEFAWEVLDLDTIGWVRHSIDRPGPAPMTIDFQTGTPDEILQRWRDTYGDLHSFATIAHAAQALFNLNHAEAVPYLSWVLDRPDCLERERSAIEYDVIRPLGHVQVMTPRRA